MNKLVKKGNKLLSLIVSFYNEEDSIINFLNGDKSGLLPFVAKWLYKLTILAYGLRTKVNINCDEFNIPLSNHHCNGWWWK